MRCFCTLKSKTQGVRGAVLPSFWGLGHTSPCLICQKSRFQRLVIQNPPVDLEEKRVQEGMDWIGLGNRIEPLVVSYLLKRIMGSSENRVPLDPLVNHHCCIVFYYVLSKLPFGSIAHFQTHLYCIVLAHGFKYVSYFWQMDDGILCSPIDLHVFLLLKLSTIQYGTVWLLSSCTFWWPNIDRPRRLHVMMAYDELWIFVDVGS